MDNGQRFARQLFYREIRYSEILSKSKSNKKFISMHLFRAREASSRVIFVRDLHLAF